MKQQSTRLLAWSSLVIAGLGAIGFLAMWFLGRKDAALGSGAGTGLGLLELESTIWIWPRVIESKSRAIWGVLLGIKSLLIYSLIGIMILVLKISGFGFIIGFSAAVLGILIVAVGMRPGGKEEKG